ncbi:hypothetical protein N7V53_07985 [Kosakonia sp. HypNH10]|uniref:hypothetical protein n=1 Tax=Kosakonia sp. HypNH10 TaxID=2980101 RepID=UPI00244BEC18|nr:hypothetical protein [Kosakonia sp. HypNH10]MDH2912464.1 hypothetical protein [Kosakonia sp. HypNH10]
MHNIFAKRGWLRGEPKAMRIAKVMLEKGMEPDVVASLTGIPVEMVEKARH